MPSIAAAGEAPQPGTPPWWTAHQERLARRRPRADGLTIERILDAALAIVDHEGLDALTVRRLAARFDTSSASLYRHVASREELLVLLIDEVLGEVRLPGPELPGRAGVEALALELRQVLQRHPNVVPALRAAPLLGPNALRGANCGLSLLLEAGYPTEVAIPGYLAMLDYVLGSVFFDMATSRHPDVEAPPDHPYGVPFPALEAHRGAINRTTSADVFAFGLRTFLDGLVGPGS